MAITAKRNNGFVHMIKDSKLAPKGRKALKEKFQLHSGLGRKMAPLTIQLLDTLKNPDSYVTIPLEKRHKGTTLTNLRNKASRAKAKLVHAYEAETRTIYAWYEPLKAPKELASNGEEVPSTVQ